MDATADSTLRLVEQVEGLLGETDVSLLSDDDLRELLVQAEDVGRRLRAVQAEVMNAMVGRARLEPTRVASPHDRPEEFVVDEVAVLLACTRVAAGIRLATAGQAQRFPALARRWRSGGLDDAKVRIIAEAVATLVEDPYGPDGLQDSLRQADAAAVASLVEAAAEYACSHTTGQLRQWLNRRVVTIDPDAADVRHRRAMAGRRVVITPGQDGMSELWALLPSVQARLIQQVLGKMAHDESDARTADQRRADGLYDLVVGRATPPAIQTSLILTGVVGADRQVELDGSGQLAGVGTITRSQVVELLGGAGGGDAPSGRNERPRTLPCEVSTGTVVVTAETVTGYRPSSELDRQVRARDLTCRFPGCRRSAMGSASGVDIDHTEPWPRGQTDRDNLACLCRRHHRLKHQSEWQVHQRGGGVLRWTTPTGRIFDTVPWQYVDAVEPYADGPRGP